MSHYRCPAFGQGDELQSPEGGIPLSHKELIPFSDNNLGDYYPLKVPRDQMSAFVADFTIPSAHKWFWRVRKWLCVVHYSVPAGVDVTAIFEMEGFSDDPGLAYTDEAELRSPTFGEGAHWREWRGSASGTGPHGLDVTDVTLAIGSYLTVDASDLVTPTLEQLFHIHTDGDISPRIFVKVAVDADELGGGLTVVRAQSTVTYSAGPDPWSLTLDGLDVPNTIYNGGAPPTLTVDISPVLYWTWDGRFDELTGQALINPRT